MLEFLEHNHLLGTILQHMTMLEDKSSDRIDMFGDILGKMLMTRIWEYCGWYVQHVWMLFPKLVQARYGVMITKACSDLKESCEDFDWNSGSGIYPEEQPVTLIVVMDACMIFSSTDYPGSGSINNDLITTSIMPGWGVFYTNSFFHAECDTSNERDMVMISFYLTSRERDFPDRIKSINESAIGTFSRPSRKTFKEGHCLAMTMMLLLMVMELFTMMDMMVLPVGSQAASRPVEEKKTTLNTTPMEARQILDHHVLDDIDEHVIVTSKTQEG